MAVQILYGVGNAVLRDFVDESKIIALSKLKNISVETSGSDEKIFGGDSMYPLAAFPKDKSVKVSAENALFSLKMMASTQGGNTTVGMIVMTDIVDFIVPDNGEIHLDHTPIADKAIIDGFTVSGTDTPTAGSFYLDETNKKLVFNTSDKGKSVQGVYEWESSATAETLAVLKDTMATPFKFIHRLPVYDDNNTVVGEGMLTIYKAKASGNFTFNLQPQTAYAPKLEFEALDPKRPDGKLWDYVITPVA